MNERLDHVRRRLGQVRRSPAQIKVAGVDDAAFDKNLVHRLAAVINFLCRAHLFSEPCRVRGRRQCRRVHPRNLLNRHIVGFVFNLFECRLHIGVVWTALQNCLVFQNRRGKLSHLQVGLRDAFGRADDLRLATELGVGLLEDFQ